MLMFGIMRHVGRFFRRLTKVPGLVARNGPRRSLRLVYVVMVLPIVVPVLRHALFFYVRVARGLLRRFPYRARREVRAWRPRKAELLELGKAGYRATLEDLGLEPEQLARVKALGETSDEVPLADIDQDGLLLSHVGPIPDTPQVSADDYMPRKRFLLTLVARRGGDLGVRKNFRGNVFAFAAELKALHLFAQIGCSVPAVLDVDFDRLTITESYVQGRVLRDELAKRGAVPRDRDLVNDAAFHALPAEARRLAFVVKDPRVLAEVVDAAFVDSVFEQVRRIHDTGLVLYDVKYGNIVIEKRSGRPYLLDFDWSANFAPLGRWLHRFLRDMDTGRLNRLFGTERLTYDWIRRALRGARVLPESAVYAPAYFGAGLRLGAIWNVDTGDGRWHYLLKRHLPPLAGKRVLDLGANNAFNALQMLRAGAREVVAVELNEDFLAQGRFLKAAFEWADNRIYNLTYLRENMADVPSLNLGRFDMAVALNAIYYIKDDEAARLVRHLSAVTDTFILQANNRHTDPRASLEYAVRTLRENGFPHTRVIAPWRYSRPLIIGTKE